MSTEYPCENIFNFCTFVTIVASLGATFAAQCTMCTIEIWDESEDSERTGLAEFICLGPFWLAYRFGKFDGDG